MRVSTSVAFSESGIAADDGFSENHIIILVTGSVAQIFSATFKYVFRFHNYRTNDERSSTLCGKMINILLTSYLFEFKKDVIGPLLCL